MTSGPRGHVRPHGEPGQLTRLPGLVLTVARTWWGRRSGALATSGTAVSRHPSLPSRRWAKGSREAPREAAPAPLGSSHVPLGYVRSPALRGHDEAALKSTPAWPAAR